MKRLELLDADGDGYTFRAAMGQPEQVDRQTHLDVGGATVDAVTLRVGNPQCVVLGEVTDGAAAHAGGRARGASALSGRHERRARDRRGARIACGS